MTGDTNVISASYIPPTPETGVYGVTWLGTSGSAWSRTDDAVDFGFPIPYFSGMIGNPSSPFDTISPWKDMEIVEDDEAGSLVKIPKYYYKWNRSGDSMQLQISMTQHEGFLTSPAHADRGDGQGERDVVYVGRYHCASNYKSTSGTSPIASITRVKARTNIHNLGSTIWQFDYAMFWTVNMLYLVEFADWDSQKVIGYGCGSGSKGNTGKTDSMPYHTGTMSTSKTTYATGIQYRYIEDWWANVYDWVDGIYFNGRNVYAIKNPAAFSDSSNGTLVGERASSSGYITKWTYPTVQGYEYGLYPSAVTSSQSYVNDYCSFSSSGVVLFFGGLWYDQSQYYGAFYLIGSYTASNSDSHIGCRLQKLP